MRLLVEKQGKENVFSISFDYGQRQKYEIELAAISSRKLGVRHQRIDLKVLRDISMGFSANVDTSMRMPKIKDVIGDPQPKTYVPNRNMILLSLAAAFAEANECDEVVCGLQIHDEYGYWDTTQKFVDAMNGVLVQNRKTPIEISAPFVSFSKTEELNKLLELDGDVDLAKHTITCYNPEVVRYDVVSCGECPSCSERIQAFINLGIPDPIPYQKQINWSS